MRKPHKPPLWYDSIPEGDDGVTLFRNFQSDEVVEYVRRANDAYVHWDKLRFHQHPEGLSALQAWVAVKLSRNPQLRDIPITATGKGVNFRYWIPPRQQEWLHQIDQKAGGSITSVSGNAIPDDNDRYLFNSLMEEAIASSRLEGASTTREKAKKMLRTNRKPRTRAEQMIMNNYTAILEIRDLKREKLTPALLLHLQEVLTQGTLDDASQVGRFRVASDNVAVIDSRTEEVMHDPPAASTVQSRLEELCDFANQRSKPFIHPVIKAIVLHFAVGYIHPFCDGNGRTARAVFYWYMLKHGYWLFEYLPLSRILITGPAQYERAYLYTESDGNDLTYFAHFHLRIILQAIKALHEYIDGQVREVNEATKILDSFPGLNHRQTSVVQASLKHPGRVHTIKQHCGTQHVSYATGRADLLALDDLGLLQKVQEGKQLVFHTPANLLARLKNTPKSKLTKPPLSEGASSDEGQDPQRELF